jgi:kynureninase
MSPSNATSTTYPDAFGAEESFAREVDSRDPLATYRDRFLIPRRPDGEPVIYLTGNSLGLQPAGVRDALDRELDDWAKLAVDAHFEGETPWYSYHEVFRDSGSRVVGAQPGEIVMMNSLTVNLHLMMVSFYRPTPERHKILVEPFAFPSDTYAVKTQIRYHGYDPEQAMIVAEPSRGDYLLATEAIESLLAERGDEIALVMMGGVNYFTGQLFDIERITAAARARGCRVGWDLAHAAGNAVLRLHDWGPDFAVWCSYKYLNAGPGAVAGCFVHERNVGDSTLPRFAGWWGNDPETRFRMHLQPEFVPQKRADGWQLSNPPILALAPLKVALDIFDEIGMDRLREKSVALTGYLHHLVEHSAGERIEVLTPREPSERGCQLSLRVTHHPRELARELEEEGVVVDFREPDVIRAAPVPLYNTFHEVWRFARILSRHVSAE